MTDQGPPPLDGWGVLYASVWLAFLVFPVVAAVQLDASTWRIVLVLLVITAFAATYVAAWVAADRDPAGAERRTPWLAITLLGMWAAVTTQLGETALGMLVFVAVLGCLLGSTRTATVLVVTCPTLALLTWLVVGGVVAGFLVALVVMMTLVSVVLRTMEQRRESQQAAQEQMAVADERERVARDVHDVLGHSLTVITTKAELAERLMARDTPDDRARAAAELADIQSLGREALTEVRATVSGLRVARLGEELVNAAQALAAAGIEAEVPTDPQVVDPRRRLVLAWVLREAVTNVVRHSGASRCTVELGQHSLVVGDDGRGLRGTPAGHGLRGVAERVEAVGGTLTVADAAPGARLEVAWQ